MAVKPLQGFADDSGQGHGPVFVLAGFVASAERWAAFNVDWQAILDEPIPGKSLKLEYFKTSEATLNRDGQFPATGQFAGWPVEDRDRVIRRLRTVAVTHAQFRVSASVPRGAYNHVIRGKLSKPADSPYGPAFNSIALGTIGFQRRQGISAPVDWIMDMHQGKSRAAVVRMHKQIKTRGEDWARPLVGDEPMFRDDKQFLPLQAADLLAWHFRMARLLALDGKSYQDKTWDLLQTVKSMVEHNWTHDELVRLVIALRDMANRRRMAFPYDRKNRPRR
jgi:hypothetical protein